MKTTRVVLLSTLIGLAGFYCGWSMPSYGQHAPLDGQHAAPEDSEGKDWANSLRKHMQSRFFKRIGATESQKQKLSTLFENSMEQNRPMREQAKSELTALVDLFTDSKASEDQIRKEFAELKTTHEQLVEKRLDIALKTRSILTPEQLKLVGDKFKSRMADWKGLD